MLSDDPARRGPSGSLSQQSFQARQHSVAGFSPRAVALEPVVDLQLDAEVLAVAELSPQPGRETIVDAEERVISTDPPARLDATIACVAK